MRPILSVLLLSLPFVLAAQRAPRTIAPGMSRAQVVAALGAPTTERTVGEHGYLFYRNDCGRRCGMNDLVILRRDRVIDAIFRDPARRYAGTSSSPSAIPASEAAARAAGTPVSAPRGGRPSRRPRPNDATPSIPVNPPALAPAPTKQPAPRAP
jgi:hypothetical protein